MGAASMLIAVAPAMKTTLLQSLTLNYHKLEQFEKLATQPDIFKPFFGRILCYIAQCGSLFQMCRTLIRNSIYILQSTLGCCTQIESH